MNAELRSVAQAWRRLDYGERPHITSHQCSVMTFCENVGARRRQATRFASVFFSLVLAFWTSACGSTSVTGPDPNSPPPLVTQELGTHWSDLPPLSPEAKALVQTYNLDYYPNGAVKKFTSPDLPVYVDGKVDREAIAQVLAFFNRVTVLKLSFVDEIWQAKIFIRGFPPFQPTPPYPPMAQDNGCFRVAGRHFEGKITDGLIDLNWDECPNQSNLVAWGILQIVGLFGHKSSSQDLLIRPSSGIWRLSPPFVEAVNWLYDDRVKPFITPID